MSSGPLEIVRCSTGQDSRLTFSIHGSCVCHNPAERDRCCNGQNASERSDMPCSCCDSDGCTDVLIAQLDPTLSEAPALPALLGIALQTGPHPKDLSPLQMSRDTRVRTTDLTLLLRTTQLRV